MLKISRLRCHERLRGKPHCPCLEIEGNRELGQMRKGGSKDLRFALDETKIGELLE